MMECDAGIATITGAEQDWFDKHDSINNPMLQVDMDILKKACGGSFNVAALHALMLGGVRREVRAALGAVGVLAAGETAQGLGEFLPQRHV